MAQQQKKLSYEAPAIRKVRLIQEEMAAAICKTSTSRVGPTTGCWRSNCKTRGS